MAKTSFINKKALLSIFIVLAIIAGGIGLYFLLRPKVDLNAPYNNFYDYKTDESINEVISYNTNINQYIITCEDREQDATFKQTIQNQKNIYTQITFFYNFYSSIDTEMLDNLIFAKNNDGKMLKYQQEMTKSFENLKKSANNCKNYLETYLSYNKLNIENKSNKSVIDLIDNYNNLYYFNFLNSLTNFYFNASVIYQNYLTQTYSVNRYSGYVIKSACLWQQQLTQKLTANDCDYTELQTSMSNLMRFVTFELNTANNYYNSQESYDLVLNIFNTIDINQCVEHLANNTYLDFANSQETEELKNDALLLGRDFFVIGR